MPSTINLALYRDALSSRSPHLREIRLRILAGARLFRARIVEKGSGTRVKSYQIAIGNGRLYGGVTSLKRRLLGFD